MLIPETITISPEEFESTRCLIKEVYTSLCGRHSRANIAGSDLPMDDLNELLAYMFLFEEVTYESYVNQEGFYNRFYNVDFARIRSRVLELNKVDNSQK